MLNDNKWTSLRWNKIYGKKSSDLIRKFYMERKNNLKIFLGFSVWTLAIQMYSSDRIHTHFDTA